MPEDHIGALVQAIDSDDDEAAKRHLAGLACRILNLAVRAVEALEQIAAKTT